MNNHYLIVIQLFIFIRSEHWFTILKIGSKWWNLNSTNDSPEAISDFYLSAFLSTLRAEGYSVFIAKGNLPPHGDYSQRLLNIEGSGQWYSVDELLHKVTP